MVKTKSNIIFYNTTIKQTYINLIGTIIDFKNLFKFVMNHFNHRDTENWIDILFGTFLKHPIFFPL